MLSHLLHGINTNDEPTPIVHKKKASNYLNFRLLIDIFHIVESSILCKFIADLKYIFIPSECLHNAGSMNSKIAFRYAKSLKKCSTKIKMQM